MCKCFQNCLESCYWHLIEKRFCYDENIAMYEVPGKEEKNNNFFDNMAFYDSVSVIAGRAIVTIEPLPEKVPQKPIVQQPVRRLRWQEETSIKLKPYISSSVPAIYESPEEIDEKGKDGEENDKQSKDDDTEGSEKVVEQDTTDSPKLKMATLKPGHLDPEVRRKSLRERRMSKSLYLKLDQPKELPIIRQQSMPKFYLDTPEQNQLLTSILTPGNALISSIPTKGSEFSYDLYSVVQIEKERKHNLVQVSPGQKESDKSSRLVQIKEKIKLKRNKSSLGNITNVPHSHHHM